MCTSYANVFLSFFDAKTVGIIVDDKRLIQVNIFKDGHIDYAPNALLPWTEDFLFCGGDHSQLSVIQLSPQKVLRQSKLIDKRITYRSY